LPISKNMEPNKFWEKVDKGETGSDCWLWQGGINQRGYGFCGRSEKAHRVAWELTHGAIPKGLCVCHECDVRNCVNPEHLFIGTHGDNNRDARNKGRGVYPKGEHHGRSKLTNNQVIEIRNRAFRGNYSALGREFGVSYEQVRRIAFGSEWKHIAKVKEGK